VEHDDLPELPRAEGPARSLTEARPGNTLFLNKKGEVASPGGGTIFASGLMLLAGTVVASLALSSIGAALFGLPGAIAAALISVWGVRSWLLRQVQLGNALARLAADDLHGAEKLARELAARRFTSSAIRGNALYIAASAIWLRGGLREALALTRSARVELERSRSRAMRPIAALAALNDVQLTALTGDLVAARANLEALEAGVELARGDLVEVQHVDPRLLLAFEMDDPATLPEDLHPWTQRILATQRFGSTLVLLAWAHHARGEAELADTLLDVARDRLAECHIDAAHPRLHAWYAAMRGVNLAAASTASASAEDARRPHVARS
jgi:hypothetical protein